MPLKTIAEQDSIVLKKDTNFKVFKVIKNRNVTFCKEKFNLDSLIGQPSGCSYKVIKGQLFKLNQEEILALTEKSKKETGDEASVSNGDDGHNAGESRRDNRDLIDRRENQKLTKEEINQLRKEGMTGNEIVDHLIENSSTFAKKTDYSKEKYIKKKAKKHVNVFTVLEANTRNLLNMYYSRGPTKICNLRMDSLAQILTYANVRAGGKYLVVDNCSGLVLGSMIERMNGQGLVMNLYTGTAPSKPAIELSYNFCDEQKQVLKEYPLDRIAALTNDGHDKPDSLKDEQASVPMETDKSADNGDEESDDDDDDDDGCENGEEETPSDGKPCEDKKRKRMKDKDERERRRIAKRLRISESTELLRLRDMDGLIVASKFHPTPIVIDLMKFLLPSRPIVVFCPYSEPLLDCYSHLKDRGDVLMLKLSETWLRSYQILPERSHPHVNMSGSGGFILTGLNVRNE